MRRHIRLGEAALRGVFAVALVASATLSAGRNVAAATIAKANNTNALDLGSSWTGGVVPGATDIAEFSSTNTASSTPVTIGDGVSFQGISFASTPGVSLTINAGTGGTLTLGSGGIDMTNVTLSRPLTLGSTVSLAADQEWKLGNTGSTNPALIIANGVISGDQQLTISGAAGGNGEYVALAALNTFSGGLVLAANGAMRASSSEATFSGGNVASSSFGTGPITINGGTIFGNGGTVGSAAFTIGGDFQVNNGAAGGVNSRLRVFGDFDFGAAQRTITLGRHSSNVTQLLGSGAESLRFVNVSDPTLRAAVNTYDNGSMRFVSQSATEYVTVWFDFGQDFNNGSGFTVGQNVITTLGSGFVFNTAGKRPAVGVEAGGYFNLSDASTTRNAVVRSLSGTAGTVTSLANSGATSILTIETVSGETATFSGQIVDGASLTSLVPLASAKMAVTVTGSGTQVLGGTNTYSGATTVSSGTLVINGDQSGAGGNVSVAAAGTLGGSGTIGGATTIAGTHSPGNSPGIQEFVGDLTYSSGAKVIWELAANTATQGSPSALFDQVVVGGSLNFSGATTLDLVFNAAGSSVDWSNGFWDGDRSWTIYDVTGTTTGFNNLSLGTASWNDVNGVPFATGRPGAAFELSQNGDDIVLSYVAVPEPGAGAFLLAGGLLACVAARVRFTRWPASPTSGSSAVSMG